jgi:hypothetical protein
MRLQHDGKLVLPNEDFDGLAENDSNVAWQI